MRELSERRFRKTPFLYLRRPHAILWINPKEEHNMKTIGLIGGMSWESTVTYYQIINETVKKELGGLHSSRCIL